MNKLEDLESIVMTHRPHILIITETWLNCNISDEEITPPGYKIYRKDRDTRGGGVAIMVKESLHVIRQTDIGGVECVLIKLYVHELTLAVGAFYRPPNSENTFFEKLNEFLCSSKCDTSNVLLAGDFNVPSIDWSGDFPEPLIPAAEPIVDLMLFHNLTQLVKQPTCIHKDTGSVLDLFLVSQSIVSRDVDIQVMEGISDHKMVFLSIPGNRITKTEKNRRLVPVFSRAQDVDIIDALYVSFPTFRTLYETNECSVNDMWLFF